MSGGWGQLWDGDELAGAGGANLRPRAIATSTNKELVFSHSKDQMKICRPHLTHHKQMNECECLGVCVFTALTAQLFMAIVIIEIAVLLWDFMSK